MKIGLLFASIVLAIEGKSDPYKWRHEKCAPARLHPLHGAALSSSHAPRGQSCATAVLTRRRRVCANRVLPIIVLVMLTLSVTGKIVAMTLFFRNEVCLHQPIHTPPASIIKNHNHLVISQLSGPPVLLLANQTPNLRSALRAKRLLDGPSCSSPGSHRSRSSMPS